MFMATIFQSPLLLPGKAASKCKNVNKMAEIERYKGVSLVVSSNYETVKLTDW